MKKIFTILALAALVFITDSAVSPELSFAENPLSARVKLGLSRRNRIGVNIRVIHTFRQEVETGGTCTVTLQACVTRFVPKGLSGGNKRRCDPVDIGTATVAEGETQHRFNTRSRQMARARRGSRQINVRTSSECTDADNLSETIISNGRARKASGEPGQRGITPAKFMTAIANNLT